MNQNIISKDFVCVKKDGTKEPLQMWLPVHKAVEKSAEFARGLKFEGGRMCETVFENGTHLSDDEWNTLDAILNVSLLGGSQKEIPTDIIHNTVIKALEFAAPDVSAAYREYHVEKKEFSSSIEEAIRSRDSGFSVGNAQNANADSKLSSTLKSLSGDCFEKSLNMRLLMTESDRAAHEAGYIYWHDLSALSVYPFNCCLFDAENVLNHTFSINGLAYQRPSSLREAFSTLGDAIFTAASNQYGGLTCPSVDTVLSPFAEMEYNNHFSYLLGLGISAEKASREALQHTLDEMLQGFKRWEIQFNTIGSSRGDYPFISISGGCDQNEWAVRLWSSCLNVRKTGHGESGKERPVLFPKIIFLYDKELHGKGKPLYSLYKEALACSSKTMYPDYLSLSGSGYVPDMYKKYGKRGIISPMGCRAFLSPWFERGGAYPADEADIPVFAGRFNIGVISLNLPLIYGRAKEERIDFFTLLDYYLELIRRAFKRRYKKLGELPASRNPIMFCYGGAYGGSLQETEKIAPLLKSATASFGITALNELQQFHNGKSLVEDGAFALEVMRYINKKVEEFKKADGHLYAIYGTPAETLCGRQAQQLRRKFGIVPGVSDRAYVSNSFHCHVTENISPFEKQDLEYRFWDLCNGGKIQYCKYPIDYNEDAIEALITRAMDMGLYEGANMDLCFCADCGTRRLHMPDQCPSCGSQNIYEINRMNGYLGYSRQGSSTKGYNSRIHSRFNTAKLKEIQERVSM